MGIINRYAKGLLSVLDSQTQGDTPSSMGQEVRPSMEMLPFYVASRTLEFVHVLSTGPVTGVGAIPAVLTVPAGELWFVYFASVTAIATDAFSGTVSFNLQAGNAAGPLWLGLTQVQNTQFSGLLDTSRRTASAYFGAMPLILSAGQVLQANLEIANSAPTGTGWNASVSAGILRMTA